MEFCTIGKQEDVNAGKTVSVGEGMAESGSSGTGLFKEANGKEGFQTQPASGKKSAGKAARHAGC